MRQQYVTARRLHNSLHHQTGTAVSSVVVALLLLLLLLF
jgi:hypothetical protein